MSRYRRWLIPECPDIDAALGEFFSNVGAVWQPAADVFVAGRRLWVTFELPGVQLCDLEVLVSQRVVHVRGVRRGAEPAATGVSHHLAEIRPGRFERVLELPFAVRTRKFDVSLKRGLLVLKLDRAGEEPKVIEIE